MAETDAILAAGCRWCPACRAEAYPDDAAWLDADLILASFPPLCRHASQARVQLVTPSALVPAPDLCAGTTTAGTRCRSRPGVGGRYCQRHDPKPARVRTPMDGPVMGSPNVLARPFRLYAGKVRPRLPVRA